MALAILELEGRHGDAVRFRADLGTNAYFSYAIGDGSTSSISALRRLDAPSYTSPLAGPLKPESLGRTFIDIPARLFDKDNHFVQLTTFRAPERAGPAISDVVVVPLYEAMNDDSDLTDAPLISPEPPMETYVSKDRRIRPLPRAMNVAFAYEESHPHETARALDFLGSLLGMIPGVGNLIGGLLGGGGGDAPAPAPQGAAGAGPTPPDIAKIIQQILPLLTGKTKGGARAPAAASPAPAPKAAAPRDADGEEPELAESHVPGLRVRRRARYAGAAALPLADPNFWKAAMESVVKLADLAVKNDQNLRDWIKQLNPGVDDAGLDALMKDMAAVAMNPQGDVPFRKIEGVALSFGGLSPLLVGGRPRVFFRRGRDLTLHLTLDTPKPIPRAMLLCAIKDPETGAIVVKKGFKLEKLGGGAIAPAPTIPRALLEPLASGKEYVVCASLVWKSARRDRIGVAAVQPFALCSDYVFERVGDGADVVPLSDVEQHRDFWHKAWQETLTDQVRSYELDCKYYYALDPEKGANARMETLVKTDHTGAWGERGRLKSGLILSLTELNSLLPALKKPLLDDRQLEALRSPDFVERYHRALRTKANLRGRRGDSVALWVYPEVALTPVVLKRATSADDSGQVSAFEDVTVVFPIPVSAHVIGVTSQ